MKFAQELAAEASGCLGLDSGRQLRSVEAWFRAQVALEALTTYRGRRRLSTTSQGTQRFQLGRPVRASMPGDLQVKNSLKIWDDGKRMPQPRASHASKEAVACAFQGEPVRFREDRRDVESCGCEL